MTDPSSFAYCMECLAELHDDGPCVCGSQRRGVTVTPGTAQATGTACNPGGKIKSKTREDAI